MTLNRSNFWRTGILIVVELIVKLLFCDMIIFNKKIFCSWKNFMKFDDEYFLVDKEG